MTGVLQPPIKYILVLACLVFLLIFLVFSNWHLECQNPQRDRLQSLQKMLKGLEKIFFVLFYTRILRDQPTGENIFLEWTF